MSETKLKWGIKFDRLYPPEQWALGASISHWGPETYLYINLLFVTVCIGRLFVAKEED